MSKLLSILGAAALASAIATAASASVVFNFKQVGNDVVLTGSGSFDLTGAAVFVTPFPGQQAGFVDSSIALAVGGPLTPVVFYSLSFNAGAFGHGFFVDGDIDSGDVFGVASEEGIISVYDGYVSGTPLSGSAIFDGQTFASLGLVTGSYSYELPNDTVIVNVPGVPEPAAWAMMVGGFGLVGAAIRRRRTIVSFA